MMDAKTVSDHIWNPIKELKAGTPGGRALYVVHGASGQVDELTGIAGALAPDISLYGIEALGSDGGNDIDRTVEAMATRYLEAMLAHNPDGPYYLGGYSAGGMISMEMARLMKIRGKSLSAPLIFFDCLAPEIARLNLSKVQKLWLARKWSPAFALTWIKRRKEGQRNLALGAQASEALEQGGTASREAVAQRMVRTFIKAQEGYQPTKTDFDIVLFRAKHASLQFLAGGKDLGWDVVTSGKIEIIVKNCDHMSMLSGPIATQIAEQIDRRLGA